MSKCSRCVCFFRPQQRAPRDSGGCLLVLLVVRRRSSPPIPPHAFAPLQALFFLHDSAQDSGSQRVADMVQRGFEESHFASLLRWSRIA